MRGREHPALPYDDGFEVGSYGLECHSVEVHETPGQHSGVNRAAHAQPDRSQPKNLALKFALLRWSPPANACAIDDGVTTTLHRSAESNPLTKRTTFRFEGFDWKAKFAAYDAYGAMGVATVKKQIVMAGQHLAMTLRRPSIK